MKIFQSDLREALDEVSEMVNSKHCPQWARSAYDILSTIHYVDTEGGSITLVRDLTKSDRVPREVKL